jgi:CDGSH-type Zn-finger protein
VPSGYEPARVNLEKNKSYSWCACGLSKKQPFCDGSHKQKNAQLKEDEPKYGPLRFIAEENRLALMCMCKASSNRPFCDGTHETLKKTK